MPDSTCYPGATGWEPVDWDVVETMNADQIFALMQRLSVQYLLCRRDAERAQANIEGLGEPRLLEIAQESMQSLAVDIDQLREKLNSMGFHI